MRLYMKNSKYFSIFEVMVVILVILLLITLITPVFIHLRMNARLTICKSQLRQIGILLTSYTSTYEGYLPNDDARTQTDPWLTRLINDLSSFKSKWDNTDLYSNWNGHLLPFLDTPITNYSRDAKVTIDGKVRWHKTVGFDHYSMTTPPPDPLYNGWAVISDAYTNGGFQDLKTFICPEIYNTHDVKAYIDSNQKKFPRVNIAESKIAFESLNNNYMGGGIPTTYLANEYYFGRNIEFAPPSNSLRIDQIENISKKVFLIEGGNCYGAGNYFAGGSRTDAYGLSLNAHGIGFKKNEEVGHKFSFVHDSNDTFYTSYLESNKPGKSYDLNTVNEFNSYFEGKAYMLPFFFKNWGAISGYHIISFIDPENGLIFKSFFDSRGLANQFSQFAIYDEKEYHYLTGSANLLYGDGSVQTKDQGWIFNNRHQITK